MPQNNVTFVSLTIEFNADEIRENESDARWLSNRALLFKKTDSENTKPWCMIDIKMPTDEFKASLGVMEEEACSQRLISHLKYARELGAKWVVFK